MNRKYEADSDSASDAWQTDFEDDEPSASASANFKGSNEYLDMTRNGNLELQTRPSPESPAKIAEPIRPARPLASRKQNRGSYIVTQLREQLQLRAERRQQVTLGAKPKLMEKSPEVMQHAKNRQPLLAPQQLMPPKVGFEKPTPSPEVNESIGSPKTQQPSKYKILPKPMNISRIIPPQVERPRYLPKPPSDPPRIENFDLVVRLPPDKADDCSDEDEYESMDEQTIKGLQYQALGSTKNANSTQASTSNQSLKGSKETENYDSPNVSIPEGNDEVYEIISEKPDVFKSYESTIPAPIASSSTVPRSISPRPLLTSSPQRPPKNISNASIPSTSSRPLPLIPSIPKVKPPVETPEVNIDVASYKTEPWFHNVGREEAIALIEGAAAQSSTLPPDGYFLLRPAVKAKVSQPWTLVLWYKNKTYNVPVRKRPDSQYALGTAKPDELSFASIKEMVDFYKTEDLVLNIGSGDVQPGKTRLTKSPRKKKD